MANLVRGYNERRGVLGLPYRAYSGKQWADVATIGEAVVAGNAIIQHVNFWNELIQLPTFNVTSSDTRYFAQDTGKSFPYLANGEAVISSGDVLSRSLVDRITAFYATLDTVIFSAYGYTTTRYARSYADIVSGRPESQTTDQFSSASALLIATRQQFQDGNRTIIPYDVRTATFNLPAFADVVPTRARHIASIAGINNPDLSYVEAVDFPPTSTVWDSPAYYSDERPPSVSVWGKFERSPGGIPGGFSASATINLAYTFTFTS